MKQFDWHDSGIVPGHAFSFDLDLFMSLFPAKHLLTACIFSSAVNSAIQKLHLQLLSVSNKRGAVQIPGGLFFVKKQAPQPWPFRQRALLFFNKIFI